MNMNKKNKVLDKLLNELVATVQNTKNFVIEQAPDIAKEMIAEEKIINSIIFAISAFALLLSLIGFAFGLFGPEPKNWNDFSMLALSRVIFGTISIISGAVSIGTLYDSTIKLLCLKVAPKVFLLTKLSKLVK